MSATAAKLALQVARAYCAVAEAADPPGAREARRARARYVMEKFEIGDLVVLASGSMRMAVEGVEDGRVACVWCHEGEIGRDAFDTRLLKKWEFREEEPRAPRGEGAGKPWRGDREGTGKPYHRAAAGDDRPRGKPGWDGKPREKKFFRKDG